MTRWSHVVKPWASILNDDDLTLELKRDRLAATLRASGWFSSQEDAINGDLTILIEELEGVPPDAFYIDEVLQRIYDLADEQRAWLDPVDQDRNRTAL